MNGKLKKWIKAVLLTIAGAFIASMVLVQVLLTPAVLSRIVGRVAAEYVDGDLAFGKVKASVIRNFPFLNVRIQDLSLTYPHERFAQYDSLWVESRFRNAGRADEADTLASFTDLSASVNLLKSISGDIRIRNVSLRHPRIFAHRYDTLAANWDILRLGSGEEEKQDTSTLKISVSEIRLGDRPVIIFTDPADSIFGTVRLKDLNFKGKLIVDDLTGSEVDLKVDSLFIAGRLPSDTLMLALDKLTAVNHKSHLDVETDARAYLATAALGRLEVPLSLDAGIVVAKDLDSFGIDHMHGKISSIPFSGKGEARMEGDSTWLDAGLTIEKGPAGNIIDLVGTAVPQARALKTDAVISLTASCKGYLDASRGVYPKVAAEIEVPPAGFSYEGIEDDGKVDMHIMALYDGNGHMKLDVEDLCLTIEGLDASLSGEVPDIFLDDPEARLDARLALELKPLCKWLPEDSPYSASGNLKGRLKGSLKMSQLTPYNFSSLPLEGSLESDGITISDTKDTLFAFLDRTVITLAPSGHDHRHLDEDDDDEVVGHSDREALTSITASIDSLYAEYAGDMFIRGTALKFSAHNTEQKLAGSPDLHPVEGHLDAGSIWMLDSDSLFVGAGRMNNTIHYSFTEKDGKRQPGISLASTADRLAFRSGVNRVSAENAVLKLSARSSAQAAPGSRAPGDSIRRAPGLDRRRNVPDYLSEKDFEKNDIHISLNSTLTSFIKDWSVSGGLDIATVRFITPYLPLDNSCNAVKGSFTNDRIDIKGLTLNSGLSDLSAKGSIKGMRRFFTGKRGALDIDLDLISDKIDLNEFITALYAGSLFDSEEASVAAVSDIDDKAYFESVISGTSEVPVPEESQLIVLPANIRANVRLSANEIDWSNLQINWLASEMALRERCLQLTNTLAMSNIGDIYFEGFYSSRTKKDLAAGFDLNLVNITAEKVIELFPAVDTIMPMLKSFNGLLDCELAATTALDTNMNIVLPSVNGILNISGENLSIESDGSLKDLAKTLKFRDKEITKVDSLTAQGIIHDNMLEVFPFVLKVDRYTAAMSGLQKFNQDFKYHVSVLRSPIPFKFGINLTGNFDDWRWKLGKTLYKDTNVPVFTAQIDTARHNLVSSIRNIFNKGVDRVIEDSKKDQASFEQYKSSIDYVSDFQIDSLDAKELALLDSLRQEVLTDSLKVPAPLPESPGGTE